MSTVIEETTYAHGARPTSKPRGAVSWAAIIAGAVAATTITLLLLILGTGLGFAAVSPWANEGASAETIGVSTIVWITLVSLIASALGGYMAGRLRTRWHGTKCDEIYFRDTAHGFLAWALSTLLMATLLTSAVSSLVSGTAKVGAAAVGGAAATAGVVASDDDTSGAPSDYLMDRLFRSTSSANTTSLTADGNRVAPPRFRGVSKEARKEAAQIFITGLKNDGLADDDKRYLAQVVARETNITESEAQQRIDQLYSTLAKAKQDAKEAADKAASAAAYAALWMFISLLAGAFVASLAATRGGRCRDNGCEHDACCQTTTHAERHTRV
jgi:hypothetical protein